MRISDCHRVCLDPSHSLPFFNSSQFLHSSHSHNPHIHFFFNSLLSYVHVCEDFNWSMVDIPGATSLRIMPLSFLDVINCQCSHYGLVMVECMILCRSQAGSHSVVNSWVQWSCCIKNIFCSGSSQPVVLTMSLFPFFHDSL